MGSDAHRTQPDGAFHIGMLGKQIRLMRRQASVKNVAGGAVGVLVVEQVCALYCSSQQKDKGIEPRHQSHRQGKHRIFDPVKAEIPSGQGPADLQIVIC